MTTTTTPEGYSTVTPWVIGRETAELLGFLAEAFGAEEVARLALPDGTIGHAEVRIGDAVVMAFDGKEEWGPTPAFLRLYVDDAHQATRRAVAAGATVVTEPTELFWGDRVGRVRDRWGNVYWLQEQAVALTADEVAARMEDPTFVRAMEYVQSAELVHPG